MLTKIKNKLMKLETWQKINILLWIITFILLLTFIIYDAISKANTPTANSEIWFSNGIAAIGLSFALSLFSSLISTVLFAYLARKRGK